MAREKRTLERRDFLKLAGGIAVAGVIAAPVAGCDTLTEALPGTSPEPTTTHATSGTPVQFTQETDVLIVGTGISGLSAAMAPSEAGYKVTIVDKRDILGGESFEAMGLLYVAETKLQQKAGITTSTASAWREREAFFRSIGVQSDLAYERRLFETATEWVDRMAEDYGASFADPTSYVDLGSPDAFVMSGSGLGDMSSIMTPLREALTSQGVTYLLGMRASAFILNEESTVIGMRFYVESTGSYTDVKAGAVIMATGGFISDQELMESYLPAHTALACRTTHAMGEGHRLCTSLGGQLTGMDVSAPLTSDLPHVDTWGQFAHMIHVTPAGERFAAEDVIGEAPRICFTQELGYWWTIFDNSINDNGQTRSVSYIRGQKPGRIVGPFDTWEQLADAISIPQATLKATFERYNALVASGTDSDFGKTLFLEELQGSLYAVKQFPQRFRSFGGVVVDDNTQVLASSGNPIPNVYACGTCAAGGFGGLSSQAAFGYLSGQAVVEILDADTEENPTAQTGDEAEITESEITEGSEEMGIDTVSGAYEPTEVIGTPEAAVTTE